MVGMPHARLQFRLWTLLWLVTCLGLLLGLCTDFYGLLTFFILMWLLLTIYSLGVVACASVMSLMEEFFGPSSP